MLLECNGIKVNRGPGHRPAHMEQEPERALTPTKDTQTINHGGVRICAHQAVWVVISILIKDHSRQILQIHLVDDSWAWWNNPHVAKGLRAPLRLRNGRNTVNARHTFMQLTSPSHPTHMEDQSVEPSSARTFKNSNRSLFLSNSKSWFFFKLSALSKRTTKRINFET